MSEIVTPACPDLTTIYSRWELTTQLPYFRRSSSVNAIGAMGTNRIGVPIGNNSSGVPVINNLLPWGYYSVYNQRNSSKWMGYAVAVQDLASLETAVKTVEYAFKFQDYQGRNPAGISSPTFDGRFPAIATSITTATIFDIVGNMSFFLADLQHTYHTAKSSSWFMTDSATAKHRARLFSYEPFIRVAVDWLASPIPTVESGNTTRSAMLMSNDTINPNRIFQQGLVYYGWGIYFNDANLLAMGRRIVQYGLQYQCNGYTDAVRPVTGIVTKTGYTDKPYMAFARTTDYLNAAPLGWGWFCETGGSDSSYHDTNMLFLLRLFVIIPESDKEFRDEVWRAIVLGFEWQMRMLQSDGSVSLQDNTRVFNGGETYQGKPKTVDYLEWLFVMSFFGAITQDAQIQAARTLMFIFFTRRTFTLNAPMSLYDYGKSLVLNGTIDLVGASLRLGLIQISGTHNFPYTVDLATHQFVTAIPSGAFADISTVLSNQTWDPNTGTLTADPAFCDAVQPMPSLVEVGAVVVWVDTGDPATSPLLAYSSNLTGLPYGPQGTDIVIDFYGVSNVIAVIQ